MPPRGHPRRRRIDPKEQDLDMGGGMPLPPPPPPLPLPLSPPYDRGYPDVAHSLAECARHLAEAMARILQPVERVE
ncbi:hypothetical protein SLA2020_265920 [Shorea laevis]